MLNIPFTPWPSFTREEATAVHDVLLSNKVNYWTGTEGRLFEKEFAAFTGCKHAIAVSNGTVALELALEAFGIQSGDEVITTSYTFIASASAIVMRGAVPVLADVDPNSLNITAESILAVITPKTKAIIAVHLVGNPCDMDPIIELAREHDLKVIEDCAQAHGATYKGRPVGSIGDAAAFSLCQDKIMTTGGEGGMVTCDDEDLWKRMWAYKEHGKSWDAVYNRAHAPGFRWLIESFGTNFRMRRMDEWHEARVKNAQELTETLSPYSHILRVPQPVPGHGYYKYYAFVRPENLPAGLTRDDLVAQFNTQGLPCFQGSCSEIYREKTFEDTGLRPVAPLPVAKQLGETSLMFLTHPGVHKVKINLALKSVAPLKVQE